MIRVLFVCTGNTCRSPMAAAFLTRGVQEHEELRGRVEVASAGTTASDGDPPTDEATEAMAALGIDIRLHRAQRLTAELLQGVDLVLTMTSSHKADCVSAGAAQTKVMTIGVFAGTNDEVLDPFGKGFEQYEACAAQLDRLAERVADRLDRDCVAGAPIS